MLFDTNVVLDVLLDRPPHAKPAARLFALVDNQRIEGAICATTVTTIACLAARSLGQQHAHELVREVLELCAVAAVDAGVVRNAQASGFADFEDAVVHEAARAAGADVIVTRDRKGFAAATLPALDPLELCATIVAQGG